MKVAIRADASTRLGSGHVIRCLALAESLRDSGASVVFVCRPLRGSLENYIKSCGFEVLLQKDVNNVIDEGQNFDYMADAISTRRELDFGGERFDWLVVDHYQLDYRWEDLLRSRCDRILVIDDLINREHSCEVLVNQNIFPRCKDKYRDLLPEESLLLLGPQYALLRKQFRTVRENLQRSYNEVGRILISFGGSDPSNETAKVLKSIESSLYRNMRLDVVVGSANPHKERIEKMCEALPNAEYYCQIDNIADLMAKADVAIGAGGGTLWERCCLGLPSLITIMADNQRGPVLTVRQTGAAMIMGWKDKVSPDYYVKSLDSLNAELIARMSAASFRLVDGDGCNRVAEVMLAKKGGEFAW